MKKNIITIAGSLGSGKTTTAKTIAQQLGYKHFSSGSIFRQIAAERNLSVEEINTTAELEKEIDHLTDKRIQELGESEDKLVIDSRLAWHWIPLSFKVFLSLDNETAARRIFAQIQQEGRDSESAESLEEVKRSITTRYKSELKRYMDLYGIDTTDTSPFDLVVDTKENNLEQTVEIILTQYNEWLEA